MVSSLSNFMLWSVSERGEELVHLFTVSKAPASLFQCSNLMKNTDLSLHSVSTFRALFGELWLKLAFMGCACITIHSWHSSILLCVILLRQFLLCFAVPTVGVGTSVRCWSRDRYYKPLLQPRSFLFIHIRCTSVLTGWQLVRTSL